MSKSIIVIDYGIGNVFSVCNALAKIGGSPVLSGDPTSIAKADRVVLPGVGAFSKAMHKLRRDGLDDSIARFIDTGRPFLGICIGMQVLMERSFEFGDHKGLGHIKGVVERVSNFSLLGKNVKVPIIGWSKINYKPDSNPGNDCNSLNEEEYFYFVHSYMCKPYREENLRATFECHGNKITAIIGRDNILGVQFHPERSGPEGLKFLSRFLSY